MASVGSVYVGLSSRVSVYHSTPKIFLSISWSTSFALSSGNISSTEIPVQLLKNSPSYWFFDRSIASNNFITIDGAGTSANYPSVIFFPVCSNRKL